MTKAQMQERDEARAELRALLPPGSVVYTNTKMEAVTRSGLTRMMIVIDRDITLAKVRGVVLELIENEPGSDLLVATPDGKLYQVESIQSQRVASLNWATVVVLKQDPENG